MNEEKIPWGYIAYGFAFGWLAAEMYAQFKKDRRDAQLDLIREGLQTSGLRLASNAAEGS